MPGTSPLPPLSGDDDNARRRRPRDGARGGKHPLGTFTTLARVLWVLSAMGVVIRSGVTLFTPTLQFACFSTVNNGPFTVQDTEDDYLQAGVLVDIDSQRFCFEQLSGGARGLVLAEQLPGALGYTILFFLLKRLLDHATDHGFLVASTASRLRVFGLYLLIALPALALVESLARLLLLRRALTDTAVGRSGSDWYNVLADWRYPWWTVLVGVGVLALSKLVRDSAATREVPNTIG
ncbi:hypothetical protein [Saccharothrix sp. Mg75]|uniref:hypothetical protein n=1 Tax=Saccharothrix sp. Mg75 TaxID=3445357 RepID=UPI003EE8F9EF